MLNRLALRLITVQALRGRTLAGDKVHDSDHGAIDDIAAEQPSPVIVVYTDDGHFAGGGTDLWALAGDDRHDVGFQRLVIEIGMTMRQRIIDPDTGEPDEAIVQPVTTAALELNLDIIERQVITALMDAAPEASWADLWRSLVQITGDRITQRGTSMRDGVRVAGRQIVLSVRLLKDPAPGAPIGPLWQRILAAIGATPSIAALAPVLADLLAGTDLPAWRLTMSARGLSLDDARALGIAPPPEAEETSPSIPEPGALTLEPEASPPSIEGSPL